MNQDQAKMAIIEEPAMQNGLNGGLWGYRYPYFVCGHGKGGTVLHFVIDGKSLCGLDNKKKNFVYNDQFQNTYLPKCKKCLRHLTTIAADRKTSAAE